MALQIRGSSQIKDASISLGKIEDLSAGSILGRASDAADAAPAELSGENVRIIAGLHTTDNVQFANLQAAAVNAASATLAGDIAAANATLSADLSAANATLSADLSAANATLSADLSAVGGAFSGNISAVDATMSGDISAADATLSGDLSAANATLSADLSAANATLSADLSAANATLSGNISAVDGTYSGDLSAADATLSGDLSAVGGTFSGNISAVDATMSGDIAAADATLSGDIAAVNATLSGALSATGDVSGAAATFSGALSAGAATLGAISAPSAAITNAVTAGSMASNGTLSSAGKATLNSLEVSGDADILGAAAITGAVSAASADFGDGALEAGAATLASAAISGDISADNATFSGDASAGNAAFSGTLSAGASTLASAAIAGAVSAGSFSSSSVNIDGGNIDGTAIGEESRASGKFSIVDVTGSVTCNNLTVNGTLTTIDTTNLLVKDPMIQMGEGNDSDAIDLGFIGQYDSSKYAGLVRDADDSGKFKLFYTEEDLSSAQEVDFSAATKATLDADIKGNIEYDDAKEWSMSGDVVAAAVAYDGTGNVNLSAVIQPNAVEFSMLDCEIDEDDMSSDSDQHVPTQKSVKAYVDAQVASGGLDNLSAKDMQMVDSSGSFVAVHEAIQYASVDAAVAAANMVSLSDDYVEEFKDMFMVFLNGQKLRYTHDFTLANSSELHISGDIIEDGDVLEIRHFVKS